MSKLIVIPVAGLGGSANSTCSFTDRGSLSGKVLSILKIFAASHSSLNLVLLTAFVLHASSVCEIFNFESCHRPWMHSKLHMQLHRQRIPLRCGCLLPVS